MSRVYEVNLWVDRSIADAWLAWLDDHVREIVALPGVLGASVFEVLDPTPPAGQRCWCVKYLMRDQAALDEYLARHAPRMRQAGIDRFGDAFRAERRVLAPQARFAG
jgi:hypothetical protein